VPAVGLLLDDRLPLVELPPDPAVEPEPVPATDPQGCSLSPVEPDFEGVFAPVVLLPVVDEEPGVVDGLELVLLPVPALPPVPPLLPPPLPPPDWASTAVPAINKVENTARVVSILRITSTPVLPRQEANVRWCAEFPSGARIRGRVLEALFVVAPGRHFPGDSEFF
jgi:hypothetical protein